MAPHVIEKAGHGGREKRSALGGSNLSAGWSPRASLRKMGRQPRGRRGDMVCDAPSERQQGLVARHVVCSATRGSEDLGPNRKSRLIWSMNAVHLFHGRRFAMLPNLHRFRVFIQIVAIVALLLPSLALAAGVHVLFDLETPTGGPFPSDRFAIFDSSHLTGLRVNLPQPNCATRRERPCSRQPTPCTLSDSPPARPVRRRALWKCGSIHPGRCDSHLTEACP